MNAIPEQVLTAIHERAATCDASNTFPTEDVQALRECGYLAAYVPTEYGGAGLNLEEIAAEQTKLAKASPATALAVNMHQIIVGVARHMVREGMGSGEQILTDAAAGELFAFGISEPGNDLVLFGSITEARPEKEGAYSFHGVKVFTSMAPAWTRLLTFGKDDTDPENPQSVFAVLHRIMAGSK